MIPGDWLPNCAMKRVIIHWTAGGHRATDLDTAHYHILIESDGKLVKGSHSIRDNVSTADNRYAAHTRGLNTGSIGVSACCMLGARERPFAPGRFPLTKTQWKVMAHVVAELCDFYSIPVTKQTVLGHGEVESTLGITQGGKWDPMVLPWDTSMTRRQVGSQFRAMVLERLHGGSPLVETPAAITAVVNGKTFREAQIFNEKSVLKLRPLLEAFDWTITGATGTVVKLSGVAARPKSIPFNLIDQSNGTETVPGSSAEDEIVGLVTRNGFVSARDLAEMLGLSVKWDGATRTVTIQ